MHRLPVETVTTRLNHAIDPSLHIWGWEITLYLFLGGLVAGLLILTAALELTRRQRPTSAALQWMPLVALGLLSAGMGTLFLDLEFKLHVYRFYLAFRPHSPMSWGAWILLLVYPAGLLLALGSLPETTLRRVPLLGRLALRIAAWSQQNRSLVLWTTIAVGAGLGVYTGLLLGTLTARIQWNSAVLGPLFLTSGLSTGAAFLLLCKLDAVERALLLRWDLAAILVELLLIAAMLLGFASGGASAQLAGAALLGGPWTAAFWSLVVVTGLLVPLAMELLELRRHLPLVALTPALVLVGGLALRAILLAAGQDSGYRLLP